ncbi:MAG: hypothetical protein A07HN63_00738 [uncultured archaeon A07HN63]|nr:MAG: hypothetical protein A07HN63_00738 [uncultured archaeon A07HN63]
MTDHAEYVVGVDGCASGWFAVWHTESGQLRSDRYDDFAAVVADHAAAERVLVDMPTGLPSNEPRACDTLAREQLGARGRSVFPVPCRPVIEHLNDADHDADYDRANEIQRTHLGSGLSKQAWNITPKIAAVDRLLREESPSIEIVESHPECCFAALNDGYPVAQPKGQSAGRAARFGILDSHLDDWQACYKAALDDYYRKHVARDDILDALVLTAAGQYTLTSLPTEPPTDDAGIPMQIVVPDIDASWRQFVDLADR